MNAPNAGTEFRDRRDPTTWAATMSGQATNRRPISSIDDGGHADASIGTSPAWRETIRRATQVAATDATTCLQGESGTGKEVIARFIHQRSPRKRGPFIAINCAALPEQLLESELFGFERGAFTGAQQSKPGQIELAAGGVLFLDEVTEMTPAAQAKFLRVIQEREFVRLGGTRSVRVNIRVIAATNRDLRDAVTQGRFRADLYYRLNVFDIRLPPLRQRREDILALAQRFLNEFSPHAAGAPQLMPDAIAALLRHDWPGNVRELRNVIERATIVCENSAIRAADLSLLASPVPEGDSTDLEELERRTIERVMRDANWNKVQASRKLGITRTQLYMRLRKYGLENPAALAVDAIEMASASAAR
jgi:transcriptional regulator with PAS, ATPase and Fis domain